MNKASSVVSNTAAPATKPAAAIPTAPLIRILKTSTCPNLSGSAKLSYHIGCTPESKIQFRIFANTGSGFFSKEWVSFDAILKAIDKCPKDKPLNAFWLGSLYAGKSINTPSFLMAVLLAEGLVKKVERNYEKVSHAGFVSEVNKLIASGVDLKVEDKPKKAKAHKVDAKPQQVEPQKDEAKPKAASAPAVPTKEVASIKKPTRRASTKVPAKT